MRRIFVAALAVAVLQVVTSAPASAQTDVSLTAQIIAGTRTITLATLTPASLTNIVPTTQVSSALAVTVTETAAQGLTPWHVDVKLCGANDALTAVECGLYPNVLRKSDNGAVTIPGENLSINGVSVTPAVVSLPVAPAVASAFNVALPLSLAGERRLFTTTGQETASVYTGTYVSTSTLTLTPPADTVAGSYRGYVVVTLVE